MGFDWEFILDSDNVEEAYVALVDSAPTGYYVSVPAAPVQRETPADEACCGDDEVLPFSD